MAPASGQLLDFARRYTEAWCSQDPARVAEHYQLEGSLTINHGTPSVGRAAITEAVRSFMTSFPDMRVLMDDLVVRDDAVAYHWTLVGTNTGPGGTGNRVRISGLEEWTIGGDGLVAESQGHYDQAEYDRQLAHGVDEAGYGERSSCAFVDEPAVPSRERVRGQSAGAEPPERLHLPGLARRRAPDAIRATRVW